MSNSFKKLSNKINKCPFCKKQHLKNFKTENLKVGTKGFQYL